MKSPLVADAHLERAGGPDRKEVEVAVGVLIRDDGAFLLTSRPPGKVYEGYWEFPGGKLEEGETPQACIVRELEEELGVRSIAGSVLTESVHHYPGGAINLIAVEVHLLDCEFRLSVHDAAVFVPPADLLTIQIAPAAIPIAEEVIRRASGARQAGA